MAKEIVLEDGISVIEGIYTEEDFHSDRKKVDKMDPGKMTEMLDVIYDKAIGKIPKVSRSVDDIVADYLSRYNDAKTAAKELAKYQIAKCGTSGFIAGLGGLITLPVAIPANIGSVMYVQLRMIAAIARMGGFNIRSDQVQTLVYACLTGTAVADMVKQTGIKVGEKISEVALAQIPEKVLTSINEKVGFKMIATFGSLGAVNLVELIPVAGGVIGGVIDVASTRIIADNAISLFIDKKIPAERKKLTAQVGKAAKSAAKVVGPAASKGAKTLEKAGRYVGTKAGDISTSIKTKYKESQTDKKRVKMVVKKVEAEKLTPGKMCHYIISPKRILLSWDFFTDEFGNRYQIENAVAKPSGDNKKCYEYYVEFADPGIEFTSGTILYAGEDKWRKKLPKCEIMSIRYYVANSALGKALAEAGAIDPESADLVIDLTREGLLSVKRANAALSSLNYKLGKKIAHKVFEELRDCISDGESRPVEAKDALMRRLVLHFENGEDFIYNEVRGRENGITTKDIIANLLRPRGLNIVV